MKQEQNIFDQIRPKQKPQLPDNYLAGLEQKVLERLDADETSTGGRVVRPLFWLSAIAASVMLVFMVRFFYEPVPGASNDFSELSESEILSYVDEQLDEVEEQFIVQLLAEKGVEPDLIVETTTNVEEESELQVDNSMEKGFEKLEQDEIYEYLHGEDLEQEDFEYLL
ncbi:MAG: hypothetical protein EP338_05565 [Bacteroidetes bacterium]|nr:MAG: hypothetical protein EP338_05565 [Bacteroidota bacterium]